ncbi:MAG: alpha/beta hydrolase [Actinomycetaceae bacterium]|nr:alpha/beta hydrolase [Actinomycetaceae bacterium]
MDLATYTRDADRIGSHAAIVLIPAFPFDHRMWEAVAKRFDGIPVIAVDAPGFGDSPQSSDYPSLEVYADYIAQAVQSQGVSRILACGCSLGGYTAMALVERYPKLVAGLALVGTHAGYDDFKTRAIRTEMAIEALVGRSHDKLKDAVSTQVGDTTVEEHPEIISMLKSWIDDASDDGIAWAQRAMASRPGRLDVLSRCGVPAIVMRGEQDKIVTASQAEEMAQRLAVGVRNVPRAGHLIPVEAPAAVARAILGLYPQCF